ncbi:MAG TPA: hypothetical protein VIN08_22530 [Ohtaekwangia sp.]|uniref:hypothetical protein n=1 Tax=Ohtaekwangia sp. TaxID=2066019 RepID=UPI002F927174
MISWNELKGLKYYLGFATVVLLLYIYSGMVGWRWFNPTTTTHEQSTRGHHTGRGYFYHK